MLKRKYNKDKSKTNWLWFRNQRNIVTHVRKNSMRIYMQNKCNDSRTGSGFFKAVKPLMSHEYVGENYNIISDNDVFINDSSHVCNIFNECFVNIISDIGSNDRIHYDDNTLFRVTTHDNHYPHRM